MSFTYHGYLGAYGIGRIMNVNNNEVLLISRAVDTGEPFARMEYYRLSPWAKTGEFDIPLPFVYKGERSTFRSILIESPDIYLCANNDRTMDCYKRAGNTYEKKNMNVEIPAGFEAVYHEVMETATRRYMVVALAEPNTSAYKWMLFEQDIKARPVSDSWEPIGLFYEGRDVDRSAYCQNIPDALAIHYGRLINTFKADGSIAIVMTHSCLAGSLNELSVLYLEYNPLRRKWFNVKGEEVTIPLNLTSEHAIRLPDAHRYVSYVYFAPILINDRPGVLLSFRYLNQAGQSTTALRAFFVKDNRIEIRGMLQTPYFYKFDLGVYTDGGRVITAPPALNINRLFSISYSESVDNLIVNSITTAQDPMAMDYNRILLAGRAGAGLGYIFAPNVFRPGYSGYVSYAHVSEVSVDADSSDKIKITLKAPGQFNGIIYSSWGGKTPVEGDNEVVKEIDKPQQTGFVSFAYKTHAQDAELYDLIYKYEPPASEPPQGGGGTGGLEEKKRDILKSIGLGAGLLLTMNMLTAKAKKRKR